MRINSPRSAGRKANGVVSSDEYLLDGKYSIRDLVDVRRLRGLFEEFTKTTGFTTGFVSYPDQEILIATGWRDACTKFHRSCPASLEVCRESNIYLTSCLRNQRELSIKQCSNGLVDGATPVIIRGKHLASVSTGQVMFKKPDLAFFKRRAKKYGYDEESYLAAISEVPIVTERQLKQVLRYLSRLAVFVAEEGLNALLVRESAVQLREENDRRKKSELALQKSEEKYRGLFEGSMDAVLVLDLDGAALDCNQAALRLYKCRSKHAILSRRPIDFAPDKQEDGRDSGKVAAEMINIAYKKGSHHFTWLNKKSDGAVFSSEVFLSRLDIAGKTVFHSVVRDITDRMRVENNLTDTARLLNNIINSSSDCIFCKDINLRTLLCNNAFASTLGKRPSDLYGKSDIENGWVSEYVKGNPKKGIRGYEVDDLAVLRGEEVYVPYETAPIRGEIHYFETKKMPLRDSENRIIGVVGVSRDVTERKKMAANLERINRALCAIDECNRAILTAQNENELFDEICRIIVETGGYSMAFVGLAEKDAQKTVSKVACHGSKLDFLENAQVTWSDTAYGQGPSATAIRTQKVSVCADLAASQMAASVRAEALKNGHVSGIGLPLMIGKECIGSLAIYSTILNEFDREAQRLLEGFAGNLMTGILILRARAEREKLQKDILQVGELIQQKIGEELHDDLGQQLSGMALIAGVVEANLRKSGNPFAEDLSGLLKMMKGAASTARGLAHGLYPLDLTSGGLLLALENLAEKTAKLPGVKCQLNLRRCAQFTPTQSIHLYRIAQEAVNNAIKHGKARKIMIECSHKNGRSNFMVASDGVAFKKTLQNNAGLGLRLMKYRAGLIGGILDVTEGRNGGCLVVCSLP